ncbi:MAG: tetratricopeptide repeat protein [Verrucomicrobiales bacterium]|nr:tetratricopeptide repeat protein [Verrucomicrobiales bacterium]
MSEYANADFDRFRFFRDSDENMVSFEAQAFGEQVFPVLDLEHLQLARLHVHDQAARKYDWLQAFEKEMDLLSDIEERVVSRPFTWGRDDDELFYVNCMLDGEELPAYLSREGAQSPNRAARWLMPFIRLIESDKDCPMSILRFSNRNLQVVRNLETNVPELHFTEFTAWTKPGNLVVERGPDYFLAQSFLSLISGIPIRDFTTESLPRQFDELPEDCRKAILDTFDSAPGEVEEPFFDQIRSLAEKTDNSRTPGLPRSPIRAWIRSEIEKLPNADDLPILEDEAENEADFAYAVLTETDDLPSAIQFTPGIATIPRDGWMEQHWLAIRRLGRNFANQLAVYEVEENKAVSLITEENPNGIHLRRLVRETGPMDLENTVGMATRLSSAMDGLEASSSAVPVWWLPEQNVFINLGTRDPADFVVALDNEGADFWSRVPFRLRLHQTMLGLLEGVNLPESLKEMAFELAKENPHIRRTSVLLPLVGLLLSGRKFLWDRPFRVDSEDIPDGVVEFINTTRERLIDDPQRLEMGFLTKLSNFIEVWDHETYEEETGGHRDEEPEEEKIEEEVPVKAEVEVDSGKSKKEADKLKDVLHNRLGDDTIDLDAKVEDDEVYSFLDPRNKENETDVKKADEEKDKDISTPQEPYRDGFAMNPIAADVAKKTREEKAARKKAAAKRTEELEARRKENARKLLGLEASKKTVDVGGGQGVMGWLWVMIAALMISGGLGYILHGKVSRSGKFEVASEITFPYTQYEEITSRVNPFTNTVLPGGEPESRATVALESGITDIEQAIAKSREAIEAQKFDRGVNIALWGIQLGPNSVEAGEQLESALKNWINSGIDAPSRTADPDSVAILSEYYIANRTEQTAEGLYILMASAENRNPQAMRILGLLFGQGKLVPRSPSLSRRWLEQAAKLGDRDAQFYYGESSVFGTMIVENGEGFEYLERAADSGHPRSLLFRGFCCLEGLGVGKDEKRGYEFVSRAAEKGSLEALFQMGLCRANGVGTEKSERSAASAFKTAADLGHIPAMYRHAQCLIVGYGTPKAFDEGVACMRKAAAAGYFDAQNWCSQHETEFKPVAEK